MHPIAVVTGLIVLACTVWAWPTAQQREAIRRHPRSDLLWLWVPVSAWRSRFNPTDVSKLAAWRRRLIPATATLLGFLVFAVSNPAPIDPKGAPVTTAAVKPAPIELPEPIRRPLVQQERVPTPPPSAVAPDEPMEAKRTQLRLFDTAKVSTVYKGHNVHGVRIERVAAGSFWDIVGVRSGDVVINMDGSPIDTPAAAVALLNAMERNVVLNLRVRDTDDVERTLYFNSPR